MKKLIHLTSWGLLFFLLAVNSYGSVVIRAIKIEYLPDSAEKNGWLKDAIQSTSPYQPTIALNYFINECDSDTTIGAIYSRSGKKVETLITSIRTVDILETAITQLLENTGFKVVPTLSWNLNPETIPSYLNVDFIVGGRLKTFQVESRSGLLSSVVDSKVVFDLTIADARNKEILWTGQISGHDTKKTLAHTNEYFWTDLQGSMSKSFSQAVNQVFQAEQTRKAIISLIHIATLPQTTK